VQAIRAVTVYCGSSSSDRAPFRDAAARLGELLAEEGVTLVYGGTHVGLMGILADAAIAAGGDVIGVIAHEVMDVEVPHAGLADLRVVEGMAARKAAMIELGDAFVSLPGGYGTLEEVFETLTALQLGLHVKPSGLLDVDGYYQGLWTTLDRAVSDGLLSPANRDALLLDDDPELLLDRLRRWVPGPVGKKVDGRH
jgi:uncharacterized protein (TIGR00730 family)